MSALTGDRNTPRMEGGGGRVFVYGVKASAKLFAGALAVLSSGYLKPGAAATSLAAVGRVRRFVDNTGGGDGAINAEIETGIFRWDNSTSTDAIAIADIGNDCYVVDDHTVAKTDGSSSRSKAGKIVQVDALGVWVAMGPGGVVA